jgi:tRNA(Ile)-lysidine synthase
MDHLLEQVERSIRSRRLFRRGQRILVAVSGGVDSMALLHLLEALAPKQGWRLTVAHFNHQLRGRSSDADERWVRRTAKKLGLPFVSGRADVRKFSRAHKISLEMAARKTRHVFLARTARGLNIPSIALAHHAGDQLELFFLRVFRGSGGEGLSGMKWIAPSPAGEALGASARLGPSNTAVQLIRPLLDVRKADLERFAREKKIPFREDASNDDLDIQRNRIRHELLPLIRRKYQPALDRILLRLMDIAGGEAEFVGQTAAEWLRGRKRLPFEKLPVAVQRRCIQIQLLRCKTEADFDLVECLRALPGRAVTVSPQMGVVLTREGELLLQRSKPGSSSRKVFGVGKRSRLKTELRANHGDIEFGGLRVQWRIDSRKPSISTKSCPGQEFFDADAVGSRLIFRHWQPGDRFQPIGMSSAIKLQDLFTNHKIPRQQRHELVVVTTGGGVLVWVEKLRISERFKLSKHTNRRLQWRWKRP